jgi:predicted AAA+ superfamily ATPase
MLVQRKLYNGISPYLESKEAIVVTGMRRVGKTSLLRFVFEKIKSSNKLFLDLQNPLNQKYFDHENYEMVKKNLLFLGIDLSKRAYIFLDEIQLVKSLPSVVKYLMDSCDIKFFLTGSVSFYLKNFFTESLVGRKYLFELFPLDFSEFLMFKGADIRIPKDPTGITEPMFESVDVLFSEYLNYGGFPEVVMQSSVESKQKYLDDIFSSYFQLEVMRLRDFRKNKVIQELLLLLIQRVGSSLDISKLSSELGISRLTLMDYISFLEGSYFISLLKPFSQNRDIEIRKSPKVYMCDTGILNHFAKVDEGKLFENCIFNQLRSRGRKVTYYRRKSGAEINFIFDQGLALDVRLSGSNSDIFRLQRVATDIGISKSFLICRKYGKKIPADSVAYGFNLHAIL